MPGENQLLGAVCWITAANLAGFMCFGQLGMMLRLLIGRRTVLWCGRVGDSLPESLCAGWMQ
jgi:hypothetical protein